jgi:hypothetical protein
MDSMQLSCGRTDDEDLRSRLEHFQDCFNTEPDVVMQWGRQIALIEIKVLSTEGRDQLRRQLDLGQFLGQLLGWKSHFFMIGPDHGSRPSVEDCRFISWATVADRFNDVPDVSGYIRDFAFYYRGQWQSMVAASTNQPGRTPYDMLVDRVAIPPGQSAPPSPVVQHTPKSDSGQGSPSSSRFGPWHFSHLGRGYFSFLLDAKERGIWPVRYVYTGKKGVPYGEVAKGRLVNPNWMIEGRDGRRINNRGRMYDPAHMIRWTYDEIAEFYGFRRD